MGNDLTYSVLDGIALRQASLPDDALDPVLRRELINAEVDRLWEEFKGDPFYRFTTTLAVASDTELLCTLLGQVPASTIALAGTQVITGFTETTITRNAGVFPQGALLAITLIRGFAGTWAAITSMAKVTVGGATATFELLNGFLSAYRPDTDGLVVSVLRSQSAVSVDFSPRYFDRILTVKDNIPRATQVAFDPVPDAGAFAELGLSPTKSRRVAYYHRAGTIDFFVPPGGAELGNVTVEYAGRPGRYTAANGAETILVPPERNAVLIAAVTAAFGKSAPAKSKEAQTA